MSLVSEPSQVSTAQPMVMAVEVAGIMKISNNVDVTMTSRVFCKDWGPESFS